MLDLHEEVVLAKPWIGKVRLAALKAILERSYSKSSSRRSETKSEPVLLCVWGILMPLSGYCGDRERLCGDSAKILG